MNDIVDAARNEQLRRMGGLPTDTIDFLRTYADMYEEAGQAKTARRLREAADELERLRMK